MITYLPPNSNYEHINPPTCYGACQELNILVSAVNQLQMKDHEVDNTYTKFKEIVAFAAGKHANKEVVAQLLTPYNVNDNMQCDIGEVFRGALAQPVPHDEFVLWCMQTFPFCVKKTLNWIALLLMRSKKANVNLLHYLEKTFGWTFDGSYLQELKSFDLSIAQFFVERGVSKRSELLNVAYKCFASMECILWCYSLNDTTISQNNAEKYLKHACRHGSIEHFAFALTLAYNNARNNKAKMKLDILQNCCVNACFHGHLPLFKYMHENLNISHVNMYEVIKESIYSVKENRMNPLCFYRDCAKVAHDFIEYAWDHTLIKEWNDELIRRCISQERYDVLELLCKLHWKSAQEHFARLSWFSWSTTDGQQELFFYVFAAFPLVYKCFCEAPRKELLKTILPRLEEFEIYIKECNNALLEHCALTKDVITCCVMPYVC